MIGTNLAHYRITAALGAGGMGEVWRAEDTRLGREVALKLLPADFAADPERLARFEREAKLLASLNHPNIATLHALEHLEGRHVLVMELVEGEGLDERIARGPIAVDEAIAIALQIAEGLEAAHEKGIVHRDLKPANVRIRPDGTVKVLDFGLAKAWESEHAESNLSLSPTITARHTRAGVILGTAAYMAPEQAAGVGADGRADIWAFGVVLWEMLTGHHLFDGETVSHVLASVLKDQVDLEALPSGVPSRIRDLIERCLRKKPRRRLQAIGDARILLEEYLADPEGFEPQIGPAAAVAAAPSRTRRVLPWAAAGVLAVILAATLGVLVMRRPAPARVVRFDITAPEALSEVGAPKLSPDGRAIAFNATDAKGVTQIWLRSLDDLEPRPLPGTDGATRPFWSPDSRYLGFVAGGKLKKVPLAGGPPQTLADTPTGSDGSWSTTGMILFDGQSNDPILKVPATGGTPQPAVSADASSGVTSVAWPQFLPDGKHFLYVADATGGGQRHLMVASLDGKEAPRKLLEVESLVQYAPPGYLLYVRESSLLAQPFDPVACEARGEAVPLAEQLGTTSVGLADFSASDNGTLVYRSGWTARRRLVWVDRSGAEQGDADEPAVYREMSLAPDGRRLAVTITDSRSDNSDIWLRDLERGVTSRFTFDAARDFAPVWSPDGATIVFTSTRDDTTALYTKSALGGGSPTLLFKSEGALSAQDWSRDGRFILLNRMGETTGFDIWALAVSGPDAGKATPLVESQFTEVRPAFSPDGRWFVYQSNESGRYEIYVQPFSGPGGKWQVSTDGGEEPIWSGDGKEILYLTPGGKLMAVPVTTGVTFTAGRPTPLLSVRLAPIVIRNRWVASRDGRRFLFLEPEGAARTVPMTVVMNWAEALKAR